MCGPLKEADASSEVVVDVCCGTGTIGIYTAKERQSGRVVGIEMCPGAVQDAIINADVNGVKNATFICSKGAMIKLLVFEVLHVD